MKISARETESLAVKLWNEAKKQERKKVKEFEKNYTIVKVSSRVFKALKINGTIYSEIERVMLEYKNSTPEDVARKLKDINKELFFKFGPESYDIRCKLSDIYNPIE